MEENLYTKTFNRLKNNFWIVIILILFIGITGSAKLINSVNEIRSFVIGDHVLLKSIEDIKFTIDFTPSKINKQYIIGKQEPFSIPKKSVIWKAKIYKNQSKIFEHKIRVISEEIICDLHIKDYKLLRLLHKLKSGTEIIFKGKVNDSSGDLDLDIDVEKVFFDL